MAKKFARLMLYTMSKESIIRAKIKALEMKNSIELSHSQEIQTQLVSPTKK